MDFNTYKNIRRLNKIAMTLIRYGFGGLVVEMRVVPFISTLERLFVSRKRLEGLSIPERIRLVLEELGPTFIKLGQIASTRADLLPPDWVDEFKKLQDMVPPFPFEEVRREVEGSLHAPLEKRFRSFDERPVASASIAQVHYAELHDGTKAAVKVKRPGIDRIIEEDVSVMRAVANLLERYVPVSRRYRPKEVVNEFARVIKTEQDLSREGANINRFYSLFKGHPDIQIPMVYWDHTTSSVLTMERVIGTPIDECGNLKAKGLDVKAIATKGIELFFKQVFEFGIFHADLHPGNIFVRDDGVIIYLDFGIVGRLDTGLRKYLATLLFHLVREDYHGLAKVHRQMGLIGPEVDLHEFEEALREITEPIFGRTLGEINISALLMKLIQTARSFDMLLQPNLLLLQKSMVIIEGVGRQLYPDINMWEVARPLIYRWMIREKVSPEAVFKKGSEHLRELADAAVGLPLNANNFILKALNDDLKIGFVHHRLDPVADALAGAGRRIAGGVVAASVIIASALIAVFSPKEASRLLGVPLLSWIGFALALIIGMRPIGPRGGGRPE
ncbi:MAG: 2-polyprenylphenol 6-hydroxylase [Deltaproteobacteria bacterium]|nr:2-polyprenylphenol 6-hydroxylase [Deltaproteobacteria bacterium]